jgi:hypothetical protein
LKVKHALGGRANAMFERSRHAGESSQIQDPEEVNFTVLNAPYRLLSGS